MIPQRVSCPIKATPHHTRSSKSLLELCVHTLQGFGNNLILTCHGWVLSKTLLRHPISAYYVISFIPFWLQSGKQKGRCLRAAQPDPSWQAGSLVLLHRAGELGATCCGWKGGLGRAGPAPVRAWAQRPAAAGRCAGRGTARGSRLRVRVHVRGWRGQPRLGPHAACGDRDPRALWDGAWAVPIKCFRLPAVL